MFKARAFCPSCGAPTDAASEEQIMLWEMGQSDGTEEDATVSLDAPPAALDVAPHRSFSPVPLPKPKRAATPVARSVTPSAHPPQRHLMGVTDGASALAPQPVESPEPVEPAAAAEPAHEPAPPRPPQPRVPAGVRLSRQVVKRSSGKKSEPLPPPQRPKDPVYTDEEIPDPVAETVERVAAREPNPAAPVKLRKPTRRERKIAKLMKRLGATAGEQLISTVDGTSSLRFVSLMVTNYRVAIVPHSARGVARWIPLEEVSKVSCRKGSSNLRVDASIEVLRIACRRAHKLQETVDVLRHEVKEARNGNESRHDGQLVQRWCDRAAEMSENNWAQFHLWLDRNPRVKLVALTPFAPVLYLLTQRLI